MLLDSNIIIGACKPGGNSLGAFLAHPAASISVVTRIEALGYHLISAEEADQIKLLLGDLPELPLDDDTANQAIALRKERKMYLADAIIAATALVQGLPLVTPNEADFQHIDGLELINPASGA
jgi:hypothetical protein